MVLWRKGECAGNSHEAFDIFEVPGYFFLVAFSALERRGKKMKRVVSVSAETGNGHGIALFEFSDIIFQNGFLWIAVRQLAGHQNFPGRKKHALG